MFNNIIGNDENKSSLKRIIENNNISHSYIFSGVSGIGKFLFAKEFAKAILCLNEDINKRPCGFCKSCESTENGNNPDIIIIDEHEDSIKTEQIKDLTNNILEKPIHGEKKIYIINNSENMTKEAQNSLLKTLEEPPEYAIIILITSNENLLLNTIKSRCLKISFNKLSNDEILRYFSINNENVEQKLLKAFNGSIEKALNIMDKKEIYESVEDVFENIENYNELQILNLKDKVFKDKDEVYSILDYINTIFYYKALQNIETANKYTRCLEIIEETKLRLRRNSNFDMAIDNCLLAIWEVLKLNG